MKNGRTLGGPASISVLLFFVFMVMLTACSSTTDSPKVLTKEGISPYELSENEKYILQCFDIDDTSQIISFNAPQEAIALNVNAYRLEGGEKWNNIGGGGISLGTDRKPVDKLTGTFTMQLKDHYTINFVVNTAGKVSYQTDDILLDSEVNASVIGFLQEFQEITMNTEIPVALMVYDGGTSMRSYSLQDYFEPSKFDGMDLVQVVTLEFADK